MAVLQPIYCCRPVAAPMFAVMAGIVRVPVNDSCASVGLEITEAAPKLPSRFSEKQNCSGRRGDSSGRREWGFVVMARKGDSGGSARSPRPSTSRGPPKQDESWSNSSPISRKKTLEETIHEDGKREDNEFDEDALEALFAQLEMDLEAEGISDDEDLTEEEVIELENELAVALRDIQEDEELRTMDVVAWDAVAVPEVDALKRDAKFLKTNKGKSGGQNTRIEMKDEFADAILEEYEDEEEEQRVVTLEPWQLRKLAAAVEIGRRKVNIKALSAEVGMDRFDVLAWLKNPPPELLMFSATMENEESADELPLKDGSSLSFPANSKPAGYQDSGLNGGPNWHSQKRLRKEHEATFERVFSSTDRPSNSILQNLVELTHVPRKRIVEWFEGRRKAVRGSPKFESLR